MALWLSVVALWQALALVVMCNSLPQSHGMSKESAKREFECVYADKTGNNWRERDNFVKHAGKFYPLDIDYGQEETVKLTVGAGTTSKLASPVQELIKMIFDVESMKKAMLEFEVHLPAP